MNLDALLDPFTIALLVVLGVVWPWSGAVEYRRLHRQFKENVPDAKLRFYRSSVLWQWITLAAFLAWWFWDERGADRLGLVASPSGWQWLAVGAGLAGCVVIVGQVIAAHRSPKYLSKMRNDFGELQAMFPATARELRGFYQLSITAGICEEILYRGMLFALLTSAIGTWPAAGVSCVVFGLGHIYQGPLGALKTATLGLMFTLLTVFSGSLYMAMAVHIAMDMGIGRIMATAAALPDEKAANA